ncbi:MAG: DnaJ domain-containing protein [Candidatus Nitrospinota bacterium M3_3B_026]
MTLREAYELLDVDKNASLEQVKKSYRRAARLYHPDSSFDLADTGKFHEVVTAYNTILDDRKKRSNGRGVRPGSGANGNGARRPSSRGNGWPGFSGANGARRTGWRGNGNGAFSAGSGMLTYDELLIRFDKSPNVWVRIETAHTIYSRFRERFEDFAARRLGGAPWKVQAELVTLLGKTGTPKALEIVADHLMSRNVGVLLSAYLALEEAGETGLAVIDRKIGAPSAVSYHIFKLFSRDSVERMAVKDGLVPPDRMRRLAAVSRKSGVPLRDILEGLGIPLAQPA